jgi:hypothetical protein
MTLNGQQTATPIVAFIDKEPSVTQAKFTVKLMDGTVKEYVLKTTKDGRLILN